MRSGKDAVTAYLCERYGYARFAFGDELKRYAHELFDVSERSKPRELYQWFGQTMRERDPEIWQRKCFNRITDWRVYSDDEFPAVITDTRQLNEYERCRAEGFVILRVTAPDGLRIQRSIDAKDTFNYADLAHSTESHVSSFAVDYEIENSGSLADLYARVDEIIADLNAKKIT
jgi:dephospho-CoA kinase